LSISLSKASRISEQDIKPGMAVSIDVRTGQRSVMYYIAKPIMRAFSGALGQK